MTDLYAKFRENSNWDPFDTYRVKIKVGRLVGGIPRNRELIETWLNARRDKFKDKEAQKEAAREHAELVTVDEEAEKSARGFHRVDGQLVIEGRQVKAMLKESANIIKDITPIGKVSALKSKVADKSFIPEKWIPLGREEPDGIEEKVIHVINRTGPCDSLVRYEYVEDVEVEFHVKRRVGVQGTGVDEEVFLATLDYAKDVGLGADRSQANGQFEIVSVEKTGEATVRVPAVRKKAG